MFPRMPRDGRSGVTTPAGTKEDANEAIPIPHQTPADK